MRSFLLKAGRGRHQVELRCVLMGRDVCLCLGGGESPHIGAVALAEPRDSLKNDGSRSASASIICVAGHQEDLLTRKAALNWAAALDCRVTVSAGLHINDAGSEDIEQLLLNCEMALSRGLDKLQRMKHVIFRINADYPHT